MTDQFPLAGFDTAPQPTDRLFFAMFPDVSAAAHFERLARHQCDEHRLRGTPLATERFHVTLHHLGDYAGLPRHIVAAAEQAAATVAMPPFEIAFDRVGSFDRPGNRPLVMRGGHGVAALTAFQQTLGAALKKAGLSHMVARDYTPHLTLLYDERRVAEQSVETISWTAHEFVLVHSLLGRTRHVSLGRWSLRGPARP